MHCYSSRDQCQLRCRHPYLYTVDSGLQAPVLIGVIAAVWVLKSERVLTSESIEATPINHATCARAHIHARGLARR